MTPVDDDVDLDAQPSQDSVGSSPRLAQMLGGARSAAPSRDTRTDTVRLSAMVNSAVANSSPLGGVFSTPSAAQKSGRAKKPRGHRRLDWLNLSVGAVAAVAVAGTALFAGVQVANASPAADAVHVLTGDEAALASAETGVTASRERLQERIETAKAGVDPVLVSLNALRPLGEQISVVDVAALDTVVASAESYRSALGEIELVEPPAPYSRRGVDEESLSSVGSAIDRVRERVAVVDATAEKLRADRSSVDALTDTYQAQLASFAARFPAAAIAEVEANEVAGEEFRSAVTAAAATVAATPLDGATGAPALTAYRNAVIALRDEDVRVRILEEEARDDQTGTWRPNNPQPNNPSQDEQPVPTDPNLPVTPPAPDPTPPEGSGDAPIE
ncbi:hypothetical protein [Microbacterium sp.]|uniref:hypothetical protein n=1 Tax=Microbacterium sp. TaxID=51671 RepID=UPI003A92C248